MRLTIGSTPRPRFRLVAVATPARVPNSNCTHRTAQTGYDNGKLTTGQALDGAHVVGKTKQPSSAAMICWTGEGLAVTGCKLFGPSITDSYDYSRALVPGPLWGQAMNIGAQFSGLSTCSHRWNNPQHGDPAYLGGGLSTPLKPSNLREGWSCQICSFCIKRHERTQRVPPKSTLSFPRMAVLKILVDQRPAPRNFVEIRHNFLSCYTHVQTHTQTPLIPLIRCRE